MLVGRPKRRRFVPSLFPRKKSIITLFRANHALSHNDLLSLLMTCHSTIGSHSHQPTTLKRTTITHGSQPHPIIQRKKEKVPRKSVLCNPFPFSFSRLAHRVDSATRHNHHAHPSDSIILGLHKFRNGFFAEVQASTKKQPFRLWVFSMLLLWNPRFRSYAFLVFIKMAETRDAAAAYGVPGTPAIREVRPDTGNHGGNGSGGIRRVNFRAEIDTSPPFGSVKEAVTRFGGSGPWIPFFVSFFCTLDLWERVCFKFSF